jgi:hypothetical protein
MNQGPKKITREIPYLESNIFRHLNKSGLVLSRSWVETRAFVQVRINKMIKKFLQISLVKYIDMESKNRRNIFISKYIYNSKVSSTSRIWIPLGVGSTSGENGSELGCFN